MMEGNSKVTLADISSRIGDGIHGTPKYDTSGEYFFVNGNNLENGKVIIKSETKRISKEEFEKIKRPIGKQTIMIAINGTLGNIGFYNGEKIALGKSACYINLKENVNKYYIRYVLEHEHFQKYAYLFATGSTIKNLGLKAIRKYPINLPPLPTQRKIATILSAYDDLIENNLKRIQLLEEKAQLTYEEWFVRMKFPGHETAVMDEETGLPKGWGKVDLKEYLTIKHGYAFKGVHFIEAESKRILLTPGNFKIGGGIKLKKIKYYSEDAELPSDYILKHFDLLLTMTDLSKMGDTLGFPLLVPCRNDKMFLHNQRLGKVMPTIKNVFPKYFLYMYFKDLRYRAFVVGSSNGATVKHTSPKKILSFKPYIPPLESDVIIQFNSIVKKIYKTVDVLNQQIDYFTESRDILLPRLMTGMIDVEDLDLNIPEA